MRADPDCGVSLKQASLQDVRSATQRLGLSALDVTCRSALPRDGPATLTQPARRVVDARQSGHFAFTQLRLRSPGR